MRNGGHVAIRGLEEVARLLGEFPEDPRLHFLHGSLLAGQSRYPEARKAMATALAIAPGYALARFQLGFLELTSGEPGLALATWAPLDTLPADNPLRVFAEGLQHLIGDRFAETVRLLEYGIGLNRDNPAMNADMRLIIRELEQKALAPEADDAVSAAHLLLQRYNDKTVKH
jgi:hypothetical protein